ncbi:N-alpha-acetyltransferase 16, NatA auxiliary subunit [Thrips palmi]|uniref:N-alpha-acetyltransferase 16, NatA auxiliary subunit n=1 Tax=Thrips palmi TaxID=161013 RepID=A0A6P8YVJ0_THRPL|nr:N-alpha-acetyltransferase 16, NatA auxiliary subunit [Thrips palmi]
MPSSNPLPPKENALFKRILKCYEHKQYKNGLKFAKQILSNPKYMEHGETLAMKGLTLNCLGRKEEAYEYVKRGLRNDLRSHVCWHVYGLLQRSDKKYDEGIKCYRNALKWEKDNIQILRDLSLLQIHLRDLEGYRDTRYQLFRLRPTQRASWIGFAMSYHLIGDYEGALKILEDFRKTQADIPSSYDYEHSEVLLYQNMVIQESGALKEAVAHLEKYQEQILDKLSILETLGTLYLNLQRFDRAESVYSELIKRNPENTLYYIKFLEVKQSSDEDECVDTFEYFQKQFPRAHAPKRLALNYATGDRFRKLVDAYLRKGLHKGVPPLFVDLRSLYKVQSKADTIQDLVLSYVEQLKKSGHFSQADADAGESKEPACALLWTYYFLAQHYDFLENPEKAIFYIDAAIDHTPTLIELFVCKGRIFKHAGDAIEAFKYLDEAQGLDTADRYINSKCAKYMLRANLIDEAEETCEKFTREGVTAMENLNEMQCMWFQTECALAYQRLHRWGDALKKCHEIDRHFSEIIDDQFDFHTYCMRKMTLRSYIGLLRLEDVLRAHPFYFKAARCAIEVYLHLFENPLKDLTAEEELNTENLSPSELKKLRNKQRKARRKAELEQQEKAERAEKHQNKRPPGEEPDAPQQDELIPDKLARVEDPLEQAIKFLKPLQDLASKNIETHLMAFEIYYRKGKLLLMLQSIKRAFNLEPNNCELHTCLVRFVELVSSKLDTLEAPVADVIKQAMEPITRGRSAKQMNEDFLKENSNNLAALIQGARMMYALDQSRQEEAIKLATTLEKVQGINIKNCSRVLQALQAGDFGSCSQHLEEYKKRCHKIMIYATLFRPPPPPVLTEIGSSDNTSLEIPVPEISN